MKIGMLTQWFDPEPGPASLPGVLARELVRRGHEVQVVTGFPNYPDGKIYAGYSQRRFVDEVVDGVAIRRVALYASHDASRIGRAANYGSFGLSASVSGVDCLRNADAVWVSNSPITVAAPMSRLRRAGVPMLLHVLDLWPDNVSAAGMNAPGKAAAIIDGGLHQVTGSMYRMADRVMTISPGIAEVLVSRGVPAAKIDYVPLWANEEFFYPTSGDEQRHTLAVHDQTVVVMYAGALGRTQRIDQLIRAACAMNTTGDPPLEVWIAGSGTEEAALHALAQNESTRSPTRIRFLGRVPMPEMATLMAAADIHFVGLNTEQGSHATMPSKVQSILASGKPIISAAPGDVADLVRNDQLGVAVPPDDLSALKSALRQLTEAGRGPIAEMGEHCLELYRERFSASAGADQIETAVARIAEPNRLRVAPRPNSEADDVQLQLASKRDIEAVVAVHLASFPGFFLSFLGPRFLNEFYLALVESQQGTLVVAKRRGSIIGFVGGAIDEAAFFSELRNTRLLAFAKASVPALMRDPRIVMRLGRALKRPNESAGSPIAATLLSIGVLPSEQSNGLGALLERGFSAEMAARGVNQWTLTTDAHTENRAIRFYERLGYQRLRTLTTPEGRHMIEYSWCEARPYL